MSNRTTFKSLAIRVLDHANRPLTSEEIWKYAEKHDLFLDFTTSGKTPWATIAAQLYTDIKENLEQSPYIRVGKRPAKFWLRGRNLPDSKTATKNPDNNGEADIAEKRAINRAIDPPTESEKRKKFHERDLHPLLVHFAANDHHFNAHLKTIFHEKSSNRKAGLNEWIHPDLVGVYFPYGDYAKSTQRLQKELGNNPLKFYSFEMKKDLTIGNLRQSYFQAVSNSSWAHEGFLVALNISKNPQFQDELRRLNNAFGIGIIQLSTDSKSSKVVLPSRIQSEIDWSTADRLAKENSDFNKFLEEVFEDIQVGKVKSAYDKVLLVEEVTMFIAEKSIHEKSWGISFTSWSTDLFLIFILRLRDKDFSHQGQRKGVKAMQAKAAANLNNRRAKGYAQALRDQGLSLQGADRLNGEDHEAARGKGKPIEIASHLKWPNMGTILWEPW